MLIAFINSITFTYKLIKFNENLQIIMVNVSTSLSFLQPLSFFTFENVIYKETFGIIPLALYVW